MGSKMMWDIKVFGTTAVTTSAGVVTAGAMGGVKPRQILEILVAEAGNPVPKDRLAELLWNGEPPRSYVGTLESYVCVLRRRLSAGTDGRGSAIVTSTQGYVLDLADVRVDLVELRRLLRAARTSTPRESVQGVERALGLVRGELFASEAYAPWADRERAVVQRELVTACTQAAEQALALGDVASAARLAAAAVGQDGLAEQAAHVLIRALWSGGRRSDALRAYLELRQAMVTELGTEPGQRTQALYLEILRDEPAPARRAGDGRAEVATLMRLLRQALETIPGVEVPDSDWALSQVASRVVHAVA
jgi:DNA-binding SARP family transcriptional activator